MKMKEENPDIITVIVTQLPLKEGLKEWVNTAHNAVNYEMKKLHYRNTFKPIHWKELDGTQRKSILEYHVFLKKKRDVKIKG